MIPSQVSVYWVPFILGAYGARTTFPIGICTRICARMSAFLLVRGVRTNFLENSRFHLVKRLFFEMKSDVLKATIWDS
jgi:hypothetical protein